MIVNHDISKIVDENNDLLMAFDGKNLFPSAKFKGESFYPIVENRFLFTSDEEKDFIQ